MDSIIFAARKEVKRRAALIDELKSLDPEIAAHAVACFGSAEGAAEWLVTPARGLKLRVPIHVGRTAAGQRRILTILGQIQHGVSV
jgi:uncharacterized protein (DUF2384 family)